MTDHDFWMAIRQALLTLVDAVERTKLNYGQPRLQERRAYRQAGGQADPITNRIKPTTSDLRKAWKDANN